jgi:uncharacterized membrane protein
MDEQNSTINQEESKSVFSQEDIEKNKVVSAFAYFIFFLPLLACPGSPFGKFHANQGLLLLITCVAGEFILGLVPVFGWIILPVFSIAMFIIGIIGLINTLNGNAKELPVIGKYKIIK